MKGLSKDSANWLEVGEEGDGQRIDNYLLRLLKGVPKSHVYRILRSGEVRVNSARVGPEHRLAAGDRLRLPPLRTAERPTRAPSPRLKQVGLTATVIYEDEVVIALDKPAGVAVHGGSGVSLGVIEQLRSERPTAPFLELVHRLDRDTSGVLLIAKKRSALTDLHAQLRQSRVQKIYAALVHGRWTHSRQRVVLPLAKYVLGSGERRVRVESEGQSSETVFRLKRPYGHFSLLEAELRTGRTHQIRVHLAHLGFPIAGDDKYGDYEVNKALAKRGLGRMFLHACRVTLAHPVSGQRVTFEAPLPQELASFMSTLSPSDATTV